MSPELERQLVDKYPTLFVDYGADPSQSAMAFGFDCGDGWFDLLDTLCSQLVALDHTESGGEVQRLRARQVKQKFGTLRFYADPASDEARAMIGFAGALSAKICERCGNKGRLRPARWVKTLCDPCAEKRDCMDEPRDRDAGL
ncbi:hypothetical protein QM467_15825 [Rhodoblastus sp. 17X3]|uniref:hypothetical protein n=1 Tax=Rhodoblastus sp. 17X3 TaxID=3047026 RepID=UPI0024B7AB64|nr:hypothetical protein [Rhodoblastus sp. 17X3]MDI9849525.1 hypothetical protein [Rhodoblastus sp. 17X3]